MAPAYINAVFLLTLLSGEKYLINPPKNRVWVILHIATYKMHHTHAEEKRLFWYTTSIKHTLVFVS